MCGELTLARFGALGGDGGGQPADESVALRTEGGSVVGQGGAAGWAAAAGQLCLLGSISASSATLNPFASETIM